MCFITTSISKNEIFLFKASPQFYIFNGVLYCCELRELLSTVIWDFQQRGILGTIDFFFSIRLEAPSLLANPGLLSVVCFIDPASGSVAGFEKPTIIYEVSFMLLPHFNVYINYSFVEAFFLDSL